MSTELERHQPMGVAVPVLRDPDAVNLAGQDTGRRHLSHSELSIQLSCLRKYELHYRRRLSLISRPRPLDMGSAFQKAIELQDPEVGPALIREGARILSQEDEDRTRVEETVVRAAATLYLGQWPSVGTREYEYRVRLRSPWTGAWSQTFDLLGYADELAEGELGLEIVENKLVGQISASDIRRLPLNRQLALERYGVWRATGREVTRIRYRFIRKPSIKQKQTETVDQFCERLAADYVERPEFYSLQEHPFVSNDDLLDIECELWEWAEQLRHADKRGFYPRNTSVCHEYGGCQFLSLCLGDPDAQGLYQVRPERPKTFSIQSNPLEVGSL